LTAARLNILLAAGEPSGDLHGAGLARALLRRFPQARLWGLGGPLMREAGVDLLAHIDDLAVMGFGEVAGRLPFFVRLWRRVRRALALERPDLVIPIDYPGFNVRLARAARAAGSRVLYYIVPQVWAWHRSRIPKLVAAADRLAVILPFEQPLFEQAGGRAVFVGHPLLDVEPPPVPREMFCAANGLDPARPILALFPGSRTQEIERHLGLFAETAQHVHARRTGVQAMIAAGSAISTAAFGTGPPQTNDGWGLLQHAAVALVKSGTSTLQAALTRTPMVVTYRTSALTFALARRLVRVDHVALVNLVAGERLVPEILQAEATPQALADPLLALLDEGPARTRVLDGLTRVRRSLQAPDASGSVADRVAGLAAELLVPSP
jgi:lipid-A-disaccharide synthase